LALLVVTPPQDFAGYDLLALRCGVIMDDRV
jgi:hypothetical protein